MVKRVVARYKAASRLRLGPGKVDQAATGSLAKVKLYAKNRGDLDSAVISAAYYARKLQQTMYVYGGTSYGYGIWRVSQKPAEYLSPINNTGPFVLSVTPELVLSKHEVERDE